MVLHMAYPSQVDALRLPMMYCNVILIETEIHAAHVLVDQ